jgi:hypothetical protein
MNHACIAEKPFLLSGLHLSEGIFAPAPHPAPALRPSAPFLLAQHPHIGVLSPFLHPRSKSLDTLSRVFQGAPMPARSPSDELVFVFISFSVGSGGTGGGDPRNCDGSIAFVEDVPVVVVRAARRVICPLPLSG